VNIAAFIKLNASIAFNTLFKQRRFALIINKCCFYGGMMGLKALVTHHYWDRPGGAEIVASAFVKAFRDLGFHTEITATT
jgi:hypothetical protein